MKANQELERKSNCECRNSKINDKYTARTIQNNKVKSLFIPLTIRQTSFTHIFQLRGNVVTKTRVQKQKTRITKANKGYESINQTTTIK